MGLSEIEAARLYGLSPTAFADLDPKYKPRPRRAGERKLYPRVELEAMFLELPFWDEDGDGYTDDGEWSVT